MVDVFGLEAEFVLGAALGSGVDVTDSGNANEALLEHGLLVDAEVAQAEIAAADEADGDPAVGAVKLGVSGSGEESGAASQSALYCMGAGAG